MLFYVKQFFVFIFSSYQDNGFHNFNLSQFLPFEGIYYFHSCRGDPFFTKMQPSDIYWYKHLFLVLFLGISEKELLSLYAFAISILFLFNFANFWFWHTCFLIFKSVLVGFYGLLILVKRNSTLQEYSADSEKIWKFSLKSQ